MSRRIRTLYTLRGRIQIILDGALEDHEDKLTDIENRLQGFLETLPSIGDGEVETEHEETVIEEDE